MVTSHAAELLGLAGEIGTLAPGVVADVSVLDDARGRWALQRQRGQPGHRRAHAYAGVLSARGSAIHSHRANPSSRQRGINMACSMTTAGATATAEGGKDIGGSGVGARLQRKEDARFLRGRGEYVANIAMVGMVDVAFVRSPLAHARIRAIQKPTGPGTHASSRSTTLRM